MDRWVAAAAVLAPVAQVALMGFVGYPLARRRPDGVERFRRSGFTWWLVALAVLTLLGLLLTPDLLRPDSPSSHDPLTATRLVATLAVVLAVILALELVASTVLARATARSAVRGRDRYESALPRWAAAGPGELGVVGTTAVLEESVYRGLALSGLVVAWDLGEPVAAGIVAVAFGLAHWYYGPQQVVVKILVGSALCAAALSAGWVVAAAAHLLLNLVLTAWSRRRAARTASWPA
jgi:hypothetical protein